MSNAQTTEAFQLLVERFDVLEMISASGWTGTITFRQKEAIIQCVLINELLFKRRSAISHIREGLSMLDVLAVMKSYPDVMRPLFVYDEAPLTLEKFVLLVGIVM